MPHTATAKGAFDTGRLSKGQSKSVTICERRRLRLHLHHPSLR